MGFLDNPDVPCLIRASELKLADIVRQVNISAFSDAIVFRIDEDCVHLSRPYMVNADFSYTGGVITYIGVEEYTISKAVTVLRQRRGSELK